MQIINKEEISSVSAGCCAPPAWLITGTVGLLGGIYLGFNGHAAVYSESSGNSTDGETVVVHNHHHFNLIKI